MAVKAITPNELESALEVLPEPQYAWVKLTGYTRQASDILREAEGMVPGIKLERSGASIDALIKDPTREKIMDVYRSFYGKNELEHPDFTKPGVELFKVSWQLKKEGGIFESEITMRPEGGFDIKYWGEEPQYISQLRQVLSGSRVRLEIVVND